MKIVKTQLHNLTSFTPIDISSIEKNSSLSYDVYIKKGKDFIIIIEAGTLIDDVLYEKLKKQEKLYILKEDENKQELSCGSLKHHIRLNRDDAVKRLELLYGVNERLFVLFSSSTGNKIDINCVGLIVESIIYLLKYEQEFIRNTMPHMKNDFELQTHSLHVAIYALTLGHAIKLPHGELVKLGIAALLHDVGLKMIDSELVCKPTPLNEEEYRAVKKHSGYSVEMIKHNKILDPYIIEAVMHHHERYDGSGYPEGLEGGEISVFASILGICDVFDALTNDRPHRREYTSFDALRMMMRDNDMVSQFNQSYLKTALKLL